MVISYLHRWILGVIPFSELWIAYIVKKVFVIPFMMFL